MELPAQLRAAVDRMLEGMPLAELRAASQRLTTRYRAETRDGRMHLDSETAMKAYLAARLPATFAAVRSALAMIEQQMPDFTPGTLLDVGAGPGTALWAARDVWPSLADARMIEASDAARKVGAALADGLAGMVRCEWNAGDATSCLGALPHAELITLAYVLDELPPDRIAPLIARLWDKTGGVLVIVEPGTPAGWQRILAARRQLIEAGAQLVAPCPHRLPCPLTKPDWCHFARRVARSRLHRLTKDGDTPWEDEKYIFVAASRAVDTRRDARILAPPRQGKAWIDLKLCQPDGDAAVVTIAKRERDAYRAARKLDWGDSFNRV